MLQELKNFPAWFAVCDLPSVLLQTGSVPDSGLMDIRVHSVCENLNARQSELSIQTFLQSNSFFAVGSCLQSSVQTDETCLLSVSPGPATDGCLHYLKARTAERSGLHSQEVTQAVDKEVLPPVELLAERGQGPPAADIGRRRGKHRGPAPTRENLSLLTADGEILLSPPPDTSYNEHQPGDDRPQNPVHLHY